MRNLESESKEASGSVLGNIANDQVGVLPDLETQRGAPWRAIHPQQK